MDDVVIRPITGDDDMKAQLDLGQRAFGDSSAWQRAGWSYLAGLRAGQGLFLGAFAGGVPAGAAMIHDMRQWWARPRHPVRGHRLGQGRPRVPGAGIGRRLMTALLDAVAERGYPLSALYPATMPIYRSLGWELAGGRYTATVPARSLRTLVGQDPAAIPAGRAPPACTPPCRGRGRTRHPPGRPDAAAEVIAVIGRAHQAARDAGPLTGTKARPGNGWAEPDPYSYLAW